MEETVIVKVITTFLGTCFVFAMGGVDSLLGVLLVFIAVDYITGLIKAWRKNELSSKVGWDGLMKKVGSMLAVIIAHQMDKIDPTGTQMFRSTVITFFIANEGITLTENLALIGVPVPSIMKRALKAWKEDTEVPNEDNA